MIAMSNLEEFAQAVGRDVKRFETDYTSKAELEAKDYIEGKSDYQILKHQVESLVKQNQTFARTNGSYQTCTKTGADGLYD